jgi:hypothetical protein
MIAAAAATISSDCDDDDDDDYKECDEERKPHLAAADERWNTTNWHRYEMNGGRSERQGCDSPILKHYS